MQSNIQKNRKITRFLLFGICLLTKKKHFCSSLLPLKSFRCTSVWTEKQEYGSETHSVCV